MRRMRDALVAGALLILLVPALLVVAVGVCCAMGRPIFFHQPRAGRHGRPFNLVKFRTMREGIPGEPDEQRLTRFGRVLRRLSLDELPQLWNVLRGHMSLVGPRPLPVRYIDRYAPEQTRRLEVLPGMTGLAQVGGRNALTWDEKFALDVWYVDHRSLRLDLWILWRTLLAVVRREGVNAPNHATMPEFLGSGRT